MSAQPNDSDLPAHVLVPRTPGEWRPANPGRPRSPKQARRDLRKDRHRRRRILERAQCDPTLTHTAVRVLGVLLRHSDETASHVWPKMITIAIPVEIAVRSARRCVAELETAGYLLRFMRPVEQAMNLSNVYYFCEPAGPIPHDRPNQRRKLRIRRPHRGTLKTAGTPEGLEEPTPAGAVKPTPPQRQPGWRRELPPSRPVAAQPPPFPSSPPPSPRDDIARTASTTCFQEARAALAALAAKNRRP